MGGDRLRDGRRIAQLLASELDGRADRGLDRVAVTNADPAVEPTVEGARAFDVTRSGDVVASVFVQPEQAVVAFPTALEAVEAAAGESGLEIDRERPSQDGVRVVVSDGAAVKRVVPVIRAALDA